MLVLGLDTALRSCSVAILNGEQVLADLSEPLEKGHAERLAPMALAALRAAGVEARDLDRVGVVIGPGAFAGVRVGLAFARGLALGTRIKVVGVTSLEALANAAERRAAGLIASVIDARRGQVYAALYDRSAVLAPPFVASLEEAAARLSKAAAGSAVRVAGDGASLIDAPPNFSVEATASAIDAKIVARLAASAPEPATAPAPLYLRPPDAQRAAPSPFADLLKQDRAP